MRPASTGLLALATLALAGGQVVPASAQQPEPSPPPCASPEHRQFDFWVGSWDVTTPDGKPAGTNRIERILGGCVLEENWVGAKGGQGHSFNIYARDGRWHQTWVDDSGTLLVLAGGLVDGRMVLTGETQRKGGPKVLHEITWERLPTGQVRQHWRASRDAGATWKDVFVGIYTRKAP